MLHVRAGKNIAAEQAQKRGDGVDIHKMRVGKGQRAGHHHPLAAPEQISIAREEKATENKFLRQC